MSLERITIIFQECTIVPLLLLSFQRPAYSRGTVYHLPTCFSHLSNCNELFLIGQSAHSLTFIYIQFFLVRAHNNVINVTLELLVFQQSLHNFKQKLTSNI